MRLLVTSVTSLLLVALAATAAGASPSRNAKLTGPEQQWAAPVIQVWNLMNDGLQKVGAQTTADPRARARHGREQDAHRDARQLRLLFAGAGQARRTRPRRG